VNTRVQKIAKLKNKQYRDAFVGSQIGIGIPFQIRALREQRGWKQSHLAEKTGMLQPRISAMETPGGAKFTIETLRRLASAFDIALMVKFVPFSDLVRWSEDFNPDTFSAPSFDADTNLIERKPQEGAVSLSGGGYVFRGVGQPPLAATQDASNLDNLIVMQRPKQALTEQPSQGLVGRVGAL
jgi:transcriptional regulator with XRE-family HTH domain